MKNMVVLKNLPSNLIEEAFVVLKSNKLAKEIIYKDVNEKNKMHSTNNKEDYIIKEAEMIVMNYINKSKDNKNTTNKKKVNYTWLKIYSVVISILLFLAIIM